MLNFLGKNQIKQAPGWSPPNERTVINNVACMLPPNLEQDTVQYLLLRFRLEEIKYYLDNLTEETKYLQYYDSDFPDTSDIKSRCPPDVRIRFKLTQERAKVIESIQRIYPPFIYKNDSFIPSIDYCQEVREIYLNSNEQISAIIGKDGSNVKNIEQQFNVNISLLEIPLSLKNSTESIYKDSLCKLLIRGNSVEQITYCFQHIRNILTNKDSNNVLSSQKNDVPANDGNIPIAPWETNHEFQLPQQEEEERFEKDVYGLNSLLKNKDPGFLSLISKQGPPGS